MIRTLSLFAIVTFLSPALSLAKEGNGTGPSHSCGDLARVRLEIAVLGSNVLNAETTNVHYPNINRSDESKAYNLAVKKLRIMASQSVCKSHIFETSDAFEVRYSDKGSVKFDTFNLRDGSVVSWQRTSADNKSSIANF